MKKTIFAMALVLILAAVSFADIPHTLNYQGRLMDQGGHPVLDGSYIVYFRLYTAASGGNMVWEEQQYVATLNGYFNAVLGNTTALTASIFSQALWVGMQVGSNPEMTPRQKMSTTAYAMSVADGAITTDKIVDNSVTSTWTLNTEPAIDSPNTLWNDINAPSLPISPTGGSLLIMTSYSFYLNNTDENIGVQFRLRIDDNDTYVAPSGEGHKQRIRDQISRNIHQAGSFFTVFSDIPAGDHTVKLQWKRDTGGGIIVDDTTSISIAVVELKK